MLFNKNQGNVAPGSGAKNKKMLLPLAIVLVGLGAGYFNFQVLTVGKVQVLEATKDIPAHTTVTSSMFQTVTVSKDSIPQGAFTSQQLNEVSGKVTKVEVLPGLPVVDGDFLGQADKSVLTTEVPDGKVMVTIPVTNITGVAGALTNFDQVDIYTNFSTNQLGNVEKLILQNVQILDVQKDSNNNISAVQLALSPQDAETLLYAQNIGKIQLAVVPYNYTNVITNGVTDQLFIQQEINNGGADHINIPTPPKTQGTGH